MSHKAIICLIEVVVKVAQTVMCFLSKELRFQLWYLGFYIKCTLWNTKSIFSCHELYLKKFAHSVIQICCSEAYTFNYGEINMTVKLMGQSDFCSSWKLTLLHKIIDSVWCLYFDLKQKSKMANIAIISSNTTQSENVLIIFF